MGLRIGVVFVTGLVGLGAVEAPGSTVGSGMSRSPPGAASGSLPSALETASVAFVSCRTLLIAAIGPRIHSETVRRVPNDCASDDRFKVGA